MIDAVNWLMFKSATHFKKKKRKKDRAMSESQRSYDPCQKWVDLSISVGN